MIELILFLLAPAKKPAVKKESSSEDSSDEDNEKIKAKAGKVDIIQSFLIEKKVKTD